MRHRFYCADSGESAGSSTSAEKTDASAVNESLPRVRERAGVYDFAEETSHYHLLFESNPQPMWVFDRETLRFAEVNAMAIRHYGYSREEFLCLKVTDIRPPEDVERFKSFLDGPKAGVREGGYWRHRRRDGAIIEVHIVYQEIVFRNRPAVVCTIEDVSERRRADQMLRASEEWYRALSEYGSDVTFVLDDQDQIRYVSRSVERLLGYQTETLIGHSIHSGVHGEDVPLLTTALDALRGGQAVIEGIVYRFRHANGDWRSIESTGSNQTGNAGVAGLVLYARDVTERIRLQNQLIHAAKLAALGELVAGVAHEINNPLAAISALAQLLALNGDSTVRDDALTIRAMVDRASKIVHSLRGFAQPNGGSVTEKVGAERKTVGDLNRVSQSALEIVSASLRHQDVDVRTYLEADLPPVMITVSEMEQVVVNLLNNAAYAVRERGSGARRITITTFSYRLPGVSIGRESAFVSLLVSDNGPGMDEAVRERVFEPFYSSKRRGEGTGLGLYISYGIVTSHGGTLDVISAPNAGATFTITLPAASPRESPA